MRVFLALLLLTGAAQAGPWPRAQGEVYVFVGHEGGRDGWSGLYAEYGLPRDLTFGIVAGGHLMRPETEPRERRVRAFLRYPVLTGDWGPDWLDPWRFAVEAGIGQDQAETGEDRIRFSLGGTVGRGFETRFGNGWTTSDLRVAYASDTPLRIEIQSIVGLKPRPRWTVELGLFAEQELDLTILEQPDADLKIAPTVQYGLKPIGDLRLGLSYDDDGETAVTLGIAREF